MFAARLFSILKPYITGHPHHNPSSKSQPVIHVLDTWIHPSAAPTIVWIGSVIRICDATVTPRQDANKTVERGAVMDRRVKHGDDGECENGHASSIFHGSHEIKPKTSGYSPRI